jgi:hypothetical protein
LLINLGLRKNIKTVPNNRARKVILD